ncbi:MAG TPA: hypothetical protein GX518_02525 [Firmicutes bacterium]|nr:hypothetical protein [Bacillota bacterium]
MRPRLIHPVEVTIYKIDREATEFDPDFREPVGGIKYEQEPVILRAQVKYDRFEALNMVAAGDSPLTSGYLLAEAKDVVDTGIGKGDKITAIGDHDTELYVTEIRPAVHYGKAHMRKVYFEARRKG